MGTTKKPIAEKTERRWEDPVTHEIHTLVLDDVQKAFEKIRQTVDGQMTKLSNADNLRLVARLHEMLEGMVPHT